MKVPLKFLLLAASGCLLSAQSPQAIPILTPAPVWPGESAAAATNGTVFYDVPNVQAVILTRDGDGNVAGEVRRDVAGWAKPSVSFSVQGLPLGTLLYSYTLNDPPSARQRTNLVSVLLPDHDSGLTASGWPSTFQATSLPDRSATVSMATMRNLIWADASMSTAKIQNLQLTLQSAYLPGFGDAEVQGMVNNPVTQSDIDALSGDAAQQLAGFLASGVGSTRYKVLVPLFRPDTSKLVIASNYYYGVFSLQHARLLSPNSPYVTQLAASLQQFTMQGGTSPLQAPAAAPSTALEQLIQSAVSIAFQ